MAARTARAKDTPEAQTRALIAKLGAADQKLYRSVRTALRKRFPTATELVYDYPGNLVISYSPTDRGFEGILTLSGRPGDVRLYFGQGPKLRDPKKLLRGSAKQVRYIPVEAASRLKHPDVEALIAGAIDLAAAPMPSSGRGMVIIRPRSRR